MAEPEHTFDPHLGRQRRNLPYLMGVYLAVNAMRDVSLVVDGPDCTHFKGQYIFGKHDWYSTLYRVDGRHRVSFTGTNAENITGNRDQWISRTVQRATEDDVEAVLVTSMAPCGITGADYERIIESLDSPKAILEIPGYSLRGDWLDGYAQTLKAFARAKQLPRGIHEPHKVAIVGYLMDRNEGDHIGNLAELKRMISALGLELVSVWPQGGTWQELDAIAQAGTILSLPYGRDAARLLAIKTGARVLETEVPLGIDATRTWLETIAHFMDREQAGRAFIEAEIDRLFARLERVIPFYFLNRNVALLCDPFQLPGLGSLCTDLGMRVKFAGAIGRSGHSPSLLRGGSIGGVPIQYEGFGGESGYFDVAIAGLPVGTLVICDSESADRVRRGCPVCEFGVLSHSHHVFADAPFLGFEGALNLVSRMANALSQPVR